MGSWKNNRYRSPVRSTYTSSLSSGTPLSLYGFSPASYGVSSGYSSRSRLYSPSSTYIPSYSSSGYGSSSYSYISRYRDNSWSSYYTSAPRNDWYEAYRPTVRKRPSFSSDYTPSNSRRSSAATISPSQSVSKRGTINRQRRTIKFVDPKRKDSIPLDLTRIRRLSDAISDLPCEKTERGETEQSSSHDARDDSVQVVRVLETDPSCETQIPPLQDEGAGDTCEDRLSRPRRRSRDTGANHDKRGKRVSIEITDVICEEEGKFRKNEPCTNEVSETHPEDMMAATDICDNTIELEPKESPQPSNLKTNSKSPIRSRTPETRPEADRDDGKKTRASKREEQHSPESKVMSAPPPASRTRVRKAAEPEKKSQCKTILEKVGDESASVCTERGGMCVVEIVGEGVDPGGRKSQTVRPKVKGDSSNDSTLPGEESSPLSQRTVRENRETNVIRDSNHDKRLESKPKVVLYTEVEGFRHENKRNAYTTKTGETPALRKRPPGGNTSERAPGRSEISAPANDRVAQGESGISSGEALVQLLESQTVMNGAEQAAKSLGAGASAREAQSERVKVAGLGQKSGNGIGFAADTSMNAESRTNTRAEIAHVGNVTGSKSTEEEGRIEENLGKQKMSAVEDRKKLEVGNAQGTKSKIVAEAAVAVATHTPLETKMGSKVAKDNSGGPPLELQPLAKNSETESGRIDDLRAGSRPGAQMKKVCKLDENLKVSSADIAELDKSGINPPEFGSELGAAVGVKADKDIKNAVGSEARNITRKLEEQGDQLNELPNRSDDRTRTKVEQEKTGLDGKGRAETTGVPPVSGMKIRKKKFQSSSGASVETKSAVIASVEKQGSKEDIVEQNSGRDTLLPTRESGASTPKEGKKDGKKAEKESKVTGLREEVVMRVDEELGSTDESRVQSRSDSKDGTRHPELPNQGPNSAQTANVTKSKLLKIDRKAEAGQRTVEAASPTTYCSKTISEICNAVPGKYGGRTSLVGSQPTLNKPSQKSESATESDSQIASNRMRGTEAIPNRSEDSKTNRNEDDYLKNKSPNAKVVPPEQNAIIHKPPKDTGKKFRSPGEASAEARKLNEEKPSALRVKADGEKPSKTKPDGAAAKEQRTPGKNPGSPTSGTQPPGMTPQIIDGSEIQVTRVSQSAGFTQSDFGAATERTRAGTSQGPLPADIASSKKTQQTEQGKKQPDSIKTISKVENPMEIKVEAVKQTTPARLPNDRERSVACSTDVAATVSDSATPSSNKDSMPMIVTGPDLKKSCQPQGPVEKSATGGGMKKHNQETTKDETPKGRAEESDKSIPDTAETRKREVANEALRKQAIHDAGDQAKGAQSDEPVMEKSKRNKDAKAVQRRDDERFLLKRTQVPEENESVARDKCSKRMGAAERTRERQPEIIHSMAEISCKVDRMPPHASQESFQAADDQITQSEPRVVGILNRRASGVPRLELLHSASIDCLLPVTDDIALRAEPKSEPHPEIPKELQETQDIVETIEDEVEHHVADEVLNIPKSEDLEKALSGVESSYVDKDAESLRDSLSDDILAVKPPKSAPAGESRPLSSESLSKEQHQALESRLQRAHTSDKAVVERRATDEIIRHKSSDQPAVIRYRKYSLLDFRLLKVLGKGSFGKVFLVELRDVPIYFAMKCLKKDVVLEDDDIECTLVERQVLSLGSHNPFICKLFCTFQTDSHLFFVMEFLRGGDLMFHVQNEGSFTEDRARFYGAEIVCALKFLHRRGIVYRDLKLDNVCLDGEGHIRLIDFGMCVPRVYRYEPTAFCGTPEYMAPEVIEGKHYNYAVDWWSFGVVMYEMLRGRSPYTGCDEDELFWNVLNTEVEYPKYFTRESKDLIQSLLQRDPERRLGMPESGRGDIKDHGFFYGVNWSQVEKKQLTPQFRPFNQGANDVSNFDEDFTKEPAVLTPVAENVLATMDQDLFKEFSYTNPNMTT